MCQKINLQFKNFMSIIYEQGRIHGRTFADDWAGVVMLKPLTIQKCDGPTDGRTDGRTDRPTRQGVESRVRD